MIQQLKALADDNRLLIISCLKKGECCVCDLVTVLTISQPAVSQHLKKLKEAQIIEERTEGKWKYYKLATPMTPIVASVVNQLAVPCFTKGACSN